MGTAILLRSHDCLKGGLRRDAFSLTAASAKSQKNPKPRSRRRSSTRVSANLHDRDRNRIAGDRSPVVVKGPGANLVMGQVKILKRGEKLPVFEKIEEGFDLVLGSTDRLGPDPETVQKQIRVSDLKDVIYAGSNFSASPPPSSVPVPGFLGKKNGFAAGDLKRLL